MINITQCKKGNRYILSSMGYLFIEKPDFKNLVQPSL